MTVQTIAHMNWTVTVLNNGERMYTNTTEGITGVAVIGDSVKGEYSCVIMVEDETSPRWVYDNAEYASWKNPYVWTILENLGEAMYEVEKELIEESEDTLYEIGERYDSYDYEYERDSDLYNEW